ncbi:MAG TPA: Gmad2 immunoglobulin-like domain-containing protein, partial [Microthrixaceae bacterium]|nr:Gmad2 immunoglobulin-like domain-containing protein [Microthrixaceae bacterium]
TKASESTTTSSTVSTTSTTAVQSTTSTLPGSTDQPEQAIWPFASSQTRYSDPQKAANGFVTEYLGFVDPTVGEFQQGDSRSGEVPVTTRSGGPVTTVLVRQLDGDNWWVIGATTANLVIDAPESLATVSSPVTVSGQSTAFEGNINLEIREDGRLQPLAEGFTNGGSNGEMGPFSTSLNLTEGGSSAGAVIVKTLSAKDGNIEEASVVRVKFS